MKQWLKQLWCGIRKRHDWEWIGGGCSNRSICYLIWQCSRCEKRNKEKI